MILVIGGYGGFGARITRRLAAAGETVLVAGRSLAKARTFCGDNPRLLPLAFDRERDLVTALATHRPFAVVDATGPFQAATFVVPEACIAAGCHYFDIADGRAFVTRIGVLDEAATSAGLCVISGASSVPALSGAVIRALAEGFETVTAVEMAISASNKATAGAALTRAVLSYVGKPMQLWRGGCWAIAYGWDDLRRQSFDISEDLLLAPRLVALADVPDLDLVPDRLPGRPAVSFRAGTEFAVESVGLYALSWLVRLRLVSSLEVLGPLVLCLKALTVRFGTDRSAMIVRLFGVVAGERLERRWTLIASNGDGPEIPALAVPIFVSKLRDGTLAPGARDGGRNLMLADFARSFASLSIAQTTVEIDQDAPLYARVMGRRFEELPPRVRALHDVLRDSGWHGAALVTVGKSLVARILAAILQFPPDGQHTLHVAFSELHGSENWIRNFSGSRFRSVMSRRGTHLIERFGLMSFAFDLVGIGVEHPERQPGLSMRFVRWWIGPVPMPKMLVPKIAAFEWEAEGRFQFEVTIRSVIHYRGWLLPVSP